LSRSMGISFISYFANMIIKILLTEIPIDMSFVRNRHHVINKTTFAEAREYL
jgi:hypothetical protein